MDAQDNDRQPNEYPPHTTSSDHPWFYWNPKPDDKQPEPHQWSFLAPRPDPLSDPPMEQRELRLHIAARLFLAEYETYQKDPNSVIFNPTPAVLEALRKSLGAQS